MNLSFKDGFFFGLGFFVAGIVIAVLPTILMLLFLLPLRVVGGM